MTQSPPGETAGTLESHLLELADNGIDLIRVLWSDLHGVARGKDVVAEAFPSLLDGGLGFCQALMTTDLDANPVTDGTADPNFPDAKLKPEPGPFRPVPWEEGVAVVVASARGEDGEALPTSPRDVLLQVTHKMADLGYAGIVGPELEFYLLESDSSAPGGIRPYVDRDSAGYVVGLQSDSRGVLTRILRQCREFDLGVYAANHEFSGGQFEVNQLHSEAVDAADRAFLFKHAVKEIASTQNLRATFMGKPWDDRAGSGFHIHVSLVDARGENVFHDPTMPHGLSALAMSFLTGILDAAPALTGLLNPTVNAFKRLAPGSLAPTVANWGLDDRTAAVRVPPERGRGTRLEVRLGDATANPYLAFAALLAAGMDGMAREATPPCPGEGAQQLPTNLRDAIAALDCSTVLRDALGSKFIDAFCELKRHELTRFEHAVTDWELREYSWML
jgi:glutamine synthetase